ncbi:MAG: hypothetical protein KatS3mg105_1724 [Gemmatales bacterium]|nr:MAG: hypothetical protein KatS3mg105_1724 [Gemmatales bacterium]
MDLTVENLCSLLVRSKLLTQDGVKAMYQRWQQESKGSPTSASYFGKWLVSNHYVTPYQSSLLARGHVDSFFCNEYKILDRLGQGRMAGVYKAVHNTIGQVVAIKILPPSRARDAQMFARFQREARLALKLKHPNIVRAFEMGEANGLHYIVMEFLDGETLEDVLKRRKKLPPAEGVRIVYHALQGLQHIHEQGLVHRDMKPANIMLVPAGKPPQDNTLRSAVKILDIGLGRELFDESIVADPDNQLTGEGVLLGTPDYLSPEQARDAHRSDIRADIYSMGCVLYHVLTGQPPFPDTNIISQMVRHATEKPRPLKELNPAVPDGLQLVVNFMLAKDPGQRYPTPERAAQALKPFMSQGPEPLYNPESEPRMRSYLQWLEQKQRGGGQAAPPPAAIPAMPRPSSAPPAGIPVAAPAQAPKAALPVGIPVAPPPKLKSKHKKSKKSKKKGIPVAKPVGSRVSGKGVDVELVPVAAMPGPKRRKFLLSFRDWMLLAAGAASVGAVVLLAMFLVPLVHSPEEEPVDENPPGVVEEANKDQSKAKTKTEEQNKTNEKTKTAEEKTKTESKTKETMTKDKPPKDKMAKDSMSKEKMEKDKPKNQPNEKTKTK